MIWVRSDIRGKKKKKYCLFIYDRIWSARARKLISIHMQGIIIINYLCILATVCWRNRCTSRRCNQRRRWISRPPNFRKVRSHRKPPRSGLRIINRRARSNRRLHNWPNLISLRYLCFGPERCSPGEKRENSKHNDENASHRLFILRIMIYFIF